MKKGKLYVMGQPGPELNIRHKHWLDKEYKQWVEALQSCTVDNFKEHPMVRRMLSLDMQVDFVPNVIENNVFSTLMDIERIGYERHQFSFHHMVRMLYYAQKVLKQNPSYICEIGGGVGQFYAVLRALGYKGKYYIYDIWEVCLWQRKYLAEVKRQTGLDTFLQPVQPRTNIRYGSYDLEFDYCVSFYALGEFDDDTKRDYIENVVKKCPHGLVIWNPHSGASDKITWKCKVEPEYPLTNPNNKMLTW